MDPVTAIGLLASIVQLIDVTLKTVKYLNEVKDAPKEQAKFAREATSLLSLFTDLRYRVEESQETASSDTWFSGLKSLGRQGGPLDDFKFTMEELADKLKPAQGMKKIEKALCWTIEKKEIEAILLKIERLKSLINYALQNDHFKLSLALKEDIEGVTERLEMMKINHDAEKIYRWLAAPDPSTNHNSAQKKKQSTTGEWFTQSTEFADWKIQPNSFLWLHGIPGCGKTILASTIVQDTINDFRLNSAAAVVYFYFDFNDPEKQLLEKLIRSLIVQLVEQCSHLPNILQSAYTQSQSGQKQPTVEALKSILLETLKHYDHVYIIIDALDECTDRDNLLEWIKEFTDLKPDNLYLLATSRKERDIDEALQQLVTCQLPIQNTSVDADIRLYILERISNDPKLKKWPTSVQGEIEHALTVGAKGMFRWVVCQLDSVRKCIKLDALRKTLSALPRTLDETYKQILSNIPPENEENVLKILQWLCFSLRPMRLDEMVDILAIDSTERPCFRPEHRLPDPYDILRICSTLVNISYPTIHSTLMYRKTGTVEQLNLAHFSVKEYLVSDRIRETPICHYYMAETSSSISMIRTCLGYLSYFEKSIMLTAQTGTEFPFIAYAADQWTHHYSRINDESHRKEVDNLGYEFVVSRDDRFINWRKVYDGGFPLVRFDDKEDTTPLCHMSRLGVSGVVKKLLETRVDIDVQGGEYCCALEASAENGHENIVKLLLEGADVNLEGGYYGNALREASAGGYENIVKLLLEKDADINLQGGDYDDALPAASQAGSENIVKLLLEKGADINHEDGYHGSALQAALRAGSENIVKLLLEKGADINHEDGYHGSALQAASVYGHEKIVRLLLNKGAHTDAQGAFHGGATPLLTATENGRENIVRLLLEKGADINLQTSLSGSALQIASGAGRENIVRLLLDMEADVNLQGAYEDSALQAASLYGHEKIVRLLLDKGADVNIHRKARGREKSAMILALEKNHKAIVRVLLENGAYVDDKEWMEEVRRWAASEGNSPFILSSDDSES